MKEELEKNSSSGSIDKIRELAKKNIGKAVCTFILAGGMFCASGCSDKAEAASNNQATTEQSSDNDNESETTNASSTETEKSTEELISEAEIPAGLSDEETAKLIMDRLFDWNMAGATDELYEKTTSNGGADYDKYLSEESEKWAIIYAQALFGDDYENDQAIVTFVDGMRDINEDCLSAFLGSKAGSSHGLYSENCTIENIESVDNSDGTTTYIIDYIQADNGAETTNRDTDLYAEQTGTFNTVVVNGTVIIKSLDITDQTTNQ